MCTSSHNEIQIKTEHDIEQTLGIKTEPVNAEDGDSIPKTITLSTSSEIIWANEKKALVEKIVALRTENQNITLSLQKKKCRM